MNNQDNLDERELANKIADQTRMNKLANIVFAGHFASFLNTINYNRQIEEMRRYYSREYIYGVLSQIK